MLPTRTPGPVTGTGLLSSVAVYVTPLLLTYLRLFVPATLNVICSGLALWSDWTLHVPANPEPVPELLVKTAVINDVFPSACLRSVASVNVLPSVEIWIRRVDTSCPPEENCRSNWFRPVCFRVIEFPDPRSYGLPSKWTCSIVGAAPPRSSSNPPSVPSLNMSSGADRRLRLASFSLQVPMNRLVTANWCRVRLREARESRDVHRQNHPCESHSHQSMAATLTQKASAVSRHVDRSEQGAASRIQSRDILRSHHSRQPDAWK